jgi:hypothetical protein
MAFRRDRLRRTTGRNEQHGAASGDAIVALGLQLWRFTEDDSEAWTVGHYGKVFRWSVLNGSRSGVVRCTPIQPKGCALSGRSFADRGAMRR